MLGNGAASAGAALLAFGQALLKQGLDASKTLGHDDLQFGWPVGHANLQAGDAIGERIDSVSVSEYAGADDPDRGDENGKDDRNRPDSRLRDRRDGGPDRLGDSGGEPRAGAGGFEVVSRVPDVGGGRGRVCQLRRQAAAGCTPVRRGTAASTSRPMEVSAATTVGLGTDRGSRSAARFSHCLRRAGTPASGHVDPRGIAGLRRRAGCLREKWLRGLFRGRSARWRGFGHPF